MPSRPRERRPCQNKCAQASRLFGAPAFILSAGRPTQYTGSYVSVSINFAEARITCDCSTESNNRLLSEFVRLQRNQSERHTRRLGARRAGCPKEVGRARACRSIFGRLRQPTHKAPSG